MGYFEVVGGGTGKRYRIYAGAATNVCEVDENGRSTLGLCFSADGRAADRRIVVELLASKDFGHDPKAAEQGYAHAQSNLGTLIRDGQGVAQDDTEAVMWFRKAADQGDAVAEFLLGNQYAFGKGVPQDYSEAMSWFRKAAEQGHPRAMHDLGVIYAKGLGVPQDYVRAHMWFSLSAAQGEQMAVKTLEMAERMMTPTQITEAQKLARDWKSATQPPRR